MHADSPSHRPDMTSMFAALKSLVTKADAFPYELQAQHSLPEGHTSIWTLNDGVSKVEQH